MNPNEERNPVTPPPMPLPDSDVDPIEEEEIEGDTNFEDDGPLEDDDDLVEQEEEQSKK